LKAFNKKLEIGEISVQIEQYIRQNKKNLLIIIGISVVFIEIIIFAVAFSMSNYQPCIRIIDQNNQLIYECEADKFSIFKVYHFEKKYGTLDNYRAIIKHNDTPFPFRAWLCATFCVPALIVFVVIFILKSIMRFKR
jgi:ABC-type maltose transport system permease subunit